MLGQGSALGEDGAASVETYFASPERLADEALNQDLAFVGEHPLMNALLTTASGLVAVLNEHRQILAVNTAFLDAMGIQDAKAILGLRPGEAVQCVHAHDMEAGCGTGKFCGTCGAAIAIVASLASEKPEERRCLVTVQRSAQPMELCLKVRSCVVKLEERRVVLLFLQDITSCHRWALLERAFFHDISSLIMGISGYADLLAYGDETELRDLGVTVSQLTGRLLDEVRLHRMLLHQGLDEYPVTLRDINLEQVAQDMRGLFGSHPVAMGKRLVLPETIPSRPVVTDVSLLFRIIANMLVNAFEATDEGGEVRLWFEQDQGCTSFCVWNKAFIPENVAMRIFQRYYSTKAEMGRGLGTYAIRLLGEQFLGGKVSFTTSITHGTVFRLVLPT
jgi:signal transduction histidine kinase